MLVWGLIIHQDSNFVTCNLDSIVDAALILQTFFSVVIAEKSGNKLQNAKEFFVLTSQW